MSISFLVITASCSVYPDSPDSIHRVRSNLIRNVRTRSGAELLKQGGDLGWRDRDQWTLTQRRQDMPDHVTSVIDIGGRVDEDVTEGRALVTSDLWTATATETRNTQFSLPDGPRRPNSVCALGGIRTPGRLIRSRKASLQLSEYRRSERIGRR
jgi:hypothetical protein